MRAGLALALLLLPGSVFAMSAETLHGYRIEDPFRHLETDAGAKDFIARQNAVTEKFFAKQKKGALAIEKRLEQLSRIGVLGKLRVAGDSTFFIRRTGDAEQGALFVRTASGEERKLIDPQARDAGGKIALDWYHPSRSGKLVAFGLSRDGSEDSVLHILEVASGKELIDEITRTRHADVAWLPDESGFYYTRYPEGDRYNRRVFLHRLGDTPDKDAYVFGKEVAKTDWTSLSLSEDGSRLFLNVSKGWSQNELWMLDRKTGKLETLLSAKLDAIFGEPKWVDGRLVLLTNHEAPNFKIVSIDPQQRDPKSWRTIVPEGAWPIDGMELAAGKIAAVRLVNAVSHLEIYSVSGGKIGEIPLPDLGTIAELDADEKGTRLAFGFTSFLRPSSILELPLGGGEVRELVTLSGAPSTSGYVVEQLEYPSYDGTRVSMFVVRRRDARLDGTAATLLTAYGGFNISLTPAFSPTALYWLERGGIYAVANLRGGAERGERWHEAGKLANKHQVFRDFEYAMRHLVRERYTSPARLAITGGSNGGLLMGAMMTQAPELFRACVGRVGLYDMIRYQKFPPAELWVDEYGSADDAAQIGYLLGYSPYHQVLPGVDYPAFLGLTARADTRVSWIHTAKFVARLQADTSGKAPLLFHLEEKAGHGQGKGRSDRLKEDVQLLQFVFSQLGPATPRKSPPRPTLGAVR